MSTKYPNIHKIKTNTSTEGTHPPPERSYKEKKKKDKQIKSQENTFERLLNFITKINKDRGKTETWWKSDRFQHSDSISVTFFFGWTHSIKKTTWNSIRFYLVVIIPAGRKMGLLLFTALSWQQEQLGRCKNVSGFIQQAAETGRTVKPHWHIWESFSIATQSKSVSDIFLQT